ncbi:inositol monophosphatase [Patescibacteria group bacterium]|nr:inositol monophosphatase [Patescibacteria group bacterium]MBU1703396.1 inositol monophosphatase [Patescibacteria group bacterium]MBU1953501.1 inositol monophosphatase [Patescibacteria group bacterium]
MQENLSQYLEVSKKIAHKAGAMVLKAQQKDINIKYKSRHNLVTKFDKKSEQLISRELLEAFPTHSILGEENMGNTTNDQKYKWIIDPIDGTTNFAHGHLYYCISIGLEINGEIMVGVVFAPAFGELFYAAKGLGAFLNDKKISVSKIKTLDESLLATGFNPGIPEILEENINHFVHFQKITDGIRRCGAAALDLCYTAAGRVDGFWEKGLKPWDMAAGKIIVEEAGGLITSLNGTPFNLYDIEVLASNGLIHKEMTGYFQSATP